MEEVPRSGQGFLAKEPLRPLWVVSGYFAGHCSLLLSDCYGPVCWACGASTTAAAQFRFPLLFRPSRHD